MDEAWTPARIETMLARITDPNEVKRHYENAAPVAIGALALRCAAAARLYELAQGYGNAAMTQVATTLGISERSAARAVQFWRACFKPALDRDGESAVFLLEESQWYTTAIQAAPILEKPPVELLDDATQRKVENPKLTPTQWRKELGLSGDEGSTASQGGKLWRLLKKLAQWDDAAIADAVEGADPAKVLDDARDALVAARAAVDLLEERMAGRVDA